MLRNVIAIVAIFGFSAFTLALPAQEKATPLVTPSTADRATLVDGVIRQLAVRFDVGRPIDATLKQVLDDLHTQMGVNFQIDDVGFKNTDPPLENVEDCHVKFPKAKNVRLDQFLNLCLKPLGGTVMVRPGHLEITTLKEAWLEAAGGSSWIEPSFDDDDVVFVRPLPVSRGPIVHVLLGNRTMTEVVRDLVDQFGDRNIVVAPQVGTKARTTVLSGRLINVPLQDAVETVAELADLKCVHLDNVYLITTRDRAEPMLRELAERRDIQQIQSLLANNGIYVTPTQIRLKFFQPSQSTGESKRPVRPSWDDYARSIRDRQKP
jgi:hypothetical protein